MVEARVSLASCCWWQDKLDEANTHCKAALKLRPKVATSAQFILGGRPLEARPARRGRSPKLRRIASPGSEAGRGAISNRRHGFAQLREKWRRVGRASTSARWKCKHQVVKPSQRPYWDGFPLAGKTILLCAEQGLGDTLQFIRYAPMVKSKGATVIMACAGPMINLLSRCEGIDRFLPREGELPDVDTHIPLLNLPTLFGTTLENLPNKVPYLFADDDLIAQWRRELTVFPGFKVGIAWKGNSKHPFDRYRSIPLTQFAPLAQPDVHLLSLQKGVGTEQLQDIVGRFEVTDLGCRLDETAGAFMDTAAVMKNLDLVITTDTATAHLAGGLGVPVWVALPYVPDWRWLLDRDDSPWYPTMRLFRQSKPGKWEDVFTNIAAELGEPGPKTSRLRVDSDRNRVR